MAHEILVIEDHEDVRENIIEMLELAGYRVHQAGNGKDGVKQAIDIRPDLILCDIMMPEMDGYAVLYVLSKNQQTAHIPFVFLTAKGEKQDVREGMSKGADDYITKPFTEMELLQAVETRLKKFEHLTRGQTSLEKLDSLASVAEGATGITSLIDPKRYQTFEKKETIYREGNHAHFVYLIESGKVKTVKTNEDGKELIVDIYGPEDFFGYVPVISDEPHHHSAIALEHTECLMLPKEQFMSLLTAHNEVCIQMVKLLTQRVDSEEDALLNLAYNSVRKRVALGLLKLAEKYDAGLDGEPFPVPREDLANIVGTATESVIRVLAELREDGLIQIEGRKVRVLEPNRLKLLPY